MGKSGYGQATGEGSLCRRCAPSCTARGRKALRCRCRKGTRRLSHPGPRTRPHPNQAPGQTELHLSGRSSRLDVNPRGVISRKKKPWSANAALRRRTPSRESTPPRRCSAQAPKASASSQALSSKCHPSRVRQGRTPLREFRFRRRQTCTGTLSLGCAILTLSRRLHPPVHPKTKTPSHPLPFPS